MPFLSTPSARRATSNYLRRQEPRRISIHALCEEGDTVGAADCGVYVVFLSTPSARRATGARARRQLRPSISIHALCEEGDREKIPAAFTSKEISIHALCEEGDAMRGGYTTEKPNISIHALCEEGDSSASLGRSGATYFYPRPLRGGRHMNTYKITFTREFLSTPSARRATASLRSAGRCGGISIHALCEEGDLASMDGGDDDEISIHALCEEGDVCKIFM